MNLEIFRSSLLFSKEELQKILTKLGLSMDGKRPEMITRLTVHLSTTESDEATTGQDSGRISRIVGQLNEIRERQEDPPGDR